jgi:hypothetical protein
MQSKLTVLLAAAALAACSATATTTDKPAGGTSAVAKGTTALKIEGAAAPAPAPFVAAALTLADGVTIESAKIVVKELNIKGWEGFQGEDETEADGHDAESTEDVTTATAPRYAAAAEDVNAEQPEAESEDPTLDAEKVDYSGPYVIDLLTGVSTPSLAEAKLPEGNYSQIEFKLDAIENESEDGAGDAFAAAMTGASVEITGHIVIDGAAYGFKLLDTRDEELKWSFPQPVSISAAQVNSLVVSIPLDGWVNAAMVQAMIDAFHSGAVVPDANNVLVFTTEGAIADLMDQNITTEGHVEHEAEDAAGN